jgi:hypothetical protein
MKKLILQLNPEQRQNAIQFVLLFLVNSLEVRKSKLTCYQQKQQRLLVELAPSRDQ